METRELDRAPRLLPLYGRAVVPKRWGRAYGTGAGADGGPGAGAAAPGVRAAGEAGAEAGAGLPAVPQRRLVLRDVRPDPARLRRYAAVCGFPDDGRLPPTYPHVVAFPLAMSLMTARDFPFPLLGLVHLANRVEHLRPVDAGERLTYVVATGRAQPHPKGTAFPVAAHARLRGETVWRSTSTYLSRGPRTGNGTGSGEPPAEAPGAPELTAAAREESWRLPGSLGRSYAAASGDRNPIHLHPLTARPFGFRRAIAHGMWTKAHCLAALAAELPGAYAVDVSFRAPVLLPAAVRFRAERAEQAERAEHAAGGWAFDVRGADGGRAHLRGAVSPLGG
ncbi:MaoC/PaaZ C-terminal domain-containing protein [Streptomyces sp. NBC_01808]|uniref:MaoC family dehydratase n=1 Tax=Streptomyces sp. NBC_01808 TaxID=2975947 RepID=UPI002DDC10BF|nr:MaoC/PaaZ C-terminal domain-containing protein [Streptomyces sp. NBC_01808]WSA38340.1 MaoC/PaaZ C-terminal domain-containing protein [Streptomyces sp. NBC_01808]